MYIYIAIRQFIAFAGCNGLKESLVLNINILFSQDLLSLTRLHTKSVQLDCYNTIQSIFNWLVLLLFNILLFQLKFIVVKSFLRSRVGYKYFIANPQFFLTMVPKFWSLHYLSITGLFFFQYLHSSIRCIDPLKYCQLFPNKNLFF